MKFFFLYLVAGSLFAPAAFANSQWYVDFGRCVRLLRHDPPIDELKQEKMIQWVGESFVMVTQEIPQGASLELVARICSNARREALEKGADWAKKNCPPVERVPLNEGCPKNDADPRFDHRDVQIQDAKFTFNTPKGTASIFDCTEHEKTRKKVQLSVFCLNVVVKDKALKKIEGASPQ